MFEAASERLQSTPGLHWTTTRFATRRHDDGRITLSQDRLTFDRPGGATERPLDEEEWHVELERWFDITDLPVRQ